MATIRTIIVDNFHADPDAIRREALTLDYPVKGRFPGRSTHNVDVAHWFKVISTLLNMKICQRGTKGDAVLFRQAEAEGWTGSDIHFDLPDWAGICYLTRKAGAAGGTAFFSHLATGLDHFPTFEERLEMLKSGIIDADGPEDTPAFQRFFAKDGWDRSKWEKLLVIPYKYNRAAFYDASQFHTIDGLDAFQKCEHPRLTQNFFFDRVEPS